MQKIKLTTMKIHFPNFHVWSYFDVLVHESICLKIFFLLNLSNFSSPDRKKRWKVIQKFSVIENLILIFVCDLGIWFGGYSILGGNSILGDFSNPFLNWNKRTIYPRLDYVQHKKLGVLNRKRWCSPVYGTFFVNDPSRKIHDFAYILS